jgi:hypothetical protein
MSRNGSGTYTLPAGNPVVTGTTISSTWANSTLTNIASALTDSLAADGQTTATGNLKMGNNRITGLADGIASTDAPSLTQVTTAVAITGGTINGTTIGATTPATGKFTTLEATGVTTVQAGTAADPAITTTGDTNTGIFFPAADTIAFSEGGVESMRIDGSGNLGIGTSTPSFPLQVSKGTSGAVAFMVNPSGLTNFAVIPSNSGSTGTQIGTTGGDTFAFITNNTERMRIDSSGNIFLACTAMPSSTVGGSAFQVAESGRMQLIQSTTTTSTRALQEYYNPNGNVGSISISASATSYNTSSDYRLKENIAPMTGALDKVAQLKPCTYTWKVDGSDGQGFIAHELAEVVSGCVTGEKDAVNKDGKPIYQGIDTSFLVATLTASIQELKAIVDAQAARIAALESAGT